MEDLDARYAPPQTRVGDAGLPPGEDDIEPAARLSRLWAALVDRFIQYAVLLVIWALAPEALKQMLLQNALDLQNFQARAQEILLNELIAFALLLALNGYLLATRGQTIGKAIFRLRIARRDGSAPSFLRLAGLRYGVTQLVVTALTLLLPFLGALYALVDILFIFGDSRRCLHDRIADTMVVRA